MTSETTTTRVELYSRLLIMTYLVQGNYSSFRGCRLLKRFFKEGDKMTIFYYESKQPVLNELYSCYCITFLSFVIRKIILLFC